MAKTAVINKETKDLVGIAQSDGTAKLVYEGAGLTAEQVELVTAKNFVASERYPTFKDMCLTDAERAEAKAAADKKAAADAEKATAKEAADKAKAERAAAKAANGGTKPAAPRADALTGEYHIVKPFPATRADHPKLPIWTAIAENTTVEAAKAACPEKNPPRMTNGVYTFSSEFRYFVRAGYIAMGAPTEADAANATDSGAEQTSQEQAAA